MTFSITIQMDICSSNENMLCPKIKVLIVKILFHSLAYLLRQYMKPWLIPLCVSHGQHKDSIASWAYIAGRHRGLNSLFLWLTEPYGHCHHWVFFVRLVPSHHRDTYNQSCVHDTSFVITVCKMADVSSFGYIVHKPHYLILAAIMISYGDIDLGQYWLR